MNSLLLDGSERMPLTGEVTEVRICAMVSFEVADYPTKRDLTFSPSG